MFPSTMGAGTRVSGMVQSDLLETDGMTSLEVLRPQLVLGEKEHLLVAAVFKPMWLHSQSRNATSSPPESRRLSGLSSSCVLLRVGQ